MEKVNDRKKYLKSQTLYKPHINGMSIKKKNSKSQDSGNSKASTLTVT